jgi:hypothetical protein
MWTCSRTRSFAAASLSRSALSVYRSLIELLEHHSCFGLKRSSSRVVAMKGLTLCGNRAADFLLLPSQILRCWQVDPCTKFDRFAYEQPLGAF